MKHPVFSSRKIRSKQHLNQYVRDIYAGFSTRLHVPLNTSTEELKRHSSVNVTTEKHGDYWIAKTQMKPTARLAIPHPVFMQRRKR